MSSLLSESLPVLTVFLVLHLAIFPYLCSNLAYSVYFRGNFSTSFEADSLIERKVTYSDGRREESKIRVVILTSDRAGGEGYRLATILSVLREISRARERYQILLCSADNKEFTEIPEMPDLRVLQPCKDNRK